ncbi:Fur family transcriptional regulator [Leptospira stimsonii]|uniref:Transcriptional repressor n=1 Tax=Leptospira stimsonii TaxID=2202203 RepID=A0A4R9L731_9LEPT|nr:transcriptional repressor [Leptospira stimsonii]RHX83432.1 transcriptional repressor [Leptospira stimsonii]RHX89171.1 transcriptional repressor [Leptospira stimsonii]TGK20508.1 transcriptional repressor [Leptospira stimsonii]TGM14298.1 transcriptional repressor [Leptospira stimsonii]
MKVEAGKAALRNTKQKGEILKVLEAAKGPLSIKEIFDLSRKNLDNLGIATVYRAVNHLMETGAINEIHLPGESSRFEASHLHHHHHFHCKQCDRVFDIEICPFPLDKSPKGFTVDTHEIILYGTCSDCNSKVK